MRHDSTNSHNSHTSRGFFVGIVVIAVLIVSTTVTPSRAQTCQAMDMDVGCEQFDLTAGTMVFVPGNIDLATAEAIVVTYIGGINFITILEPCRSLLIRMVCLTYLRPCLNTTQYGVELPLQTCKSQCEWYATECASTYELFQQPLGSGLYFPPNTSFPLTCDEIDFYSQDQPMYPNDTMTYDLGNNASLTIACNNLTDAPLIVPTTCTDKLTYDPDALGCAFTCPLPALSDGQYYDAKVMQGVLAWFSWVGTALLCCCYLLNPMLRKFPRNLILMCAMAAHIAAGAIILPTMVGYDNIWCGGETQYLRPQYRFPPSAANGTSQSTDYVIEFESEDLLTESSPCSFQGAILQFGYLSATFWWGIIAFNIFLEVYFTNLLKLEGKWQTWIRIVAYHIVGWGVPFVFMVIPAAAGRIKFGPGDTYCFITDEDNQAYKLTFWVIPVGITLVLGFIFFWLAIAKIVVVMISLRKFKDLLRYFRLLVFIFLYLVLFCFIFSYNIQVAANEQTITDGYSEYFRCLTRIKENCELSDDVSNYNLIMLRGFAISVLGFMLFLIFMSWEVLKFWYIVGKSLVLLATKRNKPQLMVFGNLFLHEKAQTSTLQGTDTTLTVGDDTGPIDDEEEMQERKRDQNSDEEENENEEEEASSDTNVSSSSSEE